MKSGRIGEMKRQIPKTQNFVDREKKTSTGIEDGWGKKKELGDISRDPNDSHPHTDSVAGGDRSRKYPGN